MDCRLITLLSTNPNRLCGLSNKSNALQSPPNCHKAVLPRLGSKTRGSDGSDGKQSHTWIDHVFHG